MSIRVSENCELKRGNRTVDDVDKNLSINLMAFDISQDENLRHKFSLKT